MTFFVERKPKKKNHEFLALSNGHNCHVLSAPTNESWPFICIISYLCRNRSTSAFHTFQCSNRLAPQKKTSQFCFTVCNKKWQKNHNAKFLRSSCTWKLLVADRGEPCEQPRANTNALHVYRTQRMTSCFAGKTWGYKTKKSFAFRRCLKKKYMGIPQCWPFVDLAGSTKHKRLQPQKKFFCDKKHLFLESVCVTWRFSSKRTGGSGAGKQHQFFVLFSNPTTNWNNPKPWNTPSCFWGIIKNNWTGKPITC